MALALSTEDPESATDRQSGCISKPRVVAEAVKRAGVVAGGAPGIEPHVGAIASLKPHHTVPQGIV